jgi:cell shape-determining protein MreC
MYPSGLLLGTVTAIEADDATRTLVAEIEPAVDFEALDRIDRLVIICGYEKASGGEKK